MLYKLNTLRFQINEQTGLAFLDLFLPYLHIFHPIWLANFPAYCFIRLSLMSNLLVYEIYINTGLLGPISLWNLHKTCIHPTRLFGPTRLIGTWEYVTCHLKSKLRSWVFFGLYRDFLICVLTDQIKRNEASRLLGEDLVFLLFSS